ncbi:MAG: alanine--tRNA ligase [Endomicrobium sp.]|jgi:alanyl-tRNA synthetase|nr:alanine--tRNA ligase [Endomicrobium sp.]
MNEQPFKIRLKFLDFFINNGYTFVESASLVPKNDDTILFTSAGMVQFKQYFLNCDNKLKKATSCQKCLRTSDIESVGFTDRHLTFFEMLGNFSFDNCSKEQSIMLAWTFLTDVMLLQKKRFYVTVHEDDYETNMIWKKFIPDDKIIRMDSKTNFWDMGTTGPCGPCSEIFIDTGFETNCKKDKCGPICDCGRYIELWNLVFTQYDKQIDGSLKTLSHGNIDTGIGFERLVSVVSNKKLFDTSLFFPIIENIKNTLNLQGKYNIYRLKIIADHLRAIIFLISDGVLPSNESRGYVLRKLLRRISVQLKFFECKNVIIYKFIPTVIETQKLIHPELLLKIDYFESIVNIEEKKFLETLNIGYKMIYKIIDNCKLKNMNMIDRETIFKLYDTYGFPNDLSEEIIRENGLAIDKTDFTDAKKHLKKHDMFFNIHNLESNIYFKVSEKIKNTTFVGYNNYTNIAKVLALFKNCEKVDQLFFGDEKTEIIISKTSFYSQSGGQISDVGEIRNGLFECVVKDVFVLNNCFVHKIKILKGSIKVNDYVHTFIDIEKRKQIERYHTAVHILHQTLREMFGKHVIQSGSLITNEKARFDFTNNFAIKKYDLTRIEKKINSIIMNNFKILTKTMTIKDAINIGAVALFENKYNDLVRVVFIKCGNRNYSVELCCGTHVENTGEIGLFKIISESSISSCIRRIEFLVGTSVQNKILNDEICISKISEMFSIHRKNLLDGIQKFFVNNNKLVANYKKLKNNMLLNKIDIYEKQIEVLNGINFLSLILTDIDKETSKIISDKLTKKRSLVLLIVSQNKEKFDFSVFVATDYHCYCIYADKVAKLFSEIIGCKYGGNKYFAQGGSKNKEKLKEAIEYLKKYLNNRIHCIRQEI